jgi:hypothetical protein
MVDRRYRLEDAFDTKLKRTVALKRPHGVVSAAEVRQL